MKRLKKVAVIFLMATMIMSSICVVEAKSAHPHNGWFSDSSGTYYYRHGKVKTGYFKVHGKTYYGHKTSSAKYPRGSVTRGQMRIRHGKWYAFGYNGARYDKDVYRRKGRKKILEVDIRSRNHTVRYVYMTSRTQLGMRYSTSEKRWQEMDARGRWRTVESMQSIPWGWVDDQR